MILSTSPTAQSSALAGPCRENRRSPDAGGERGEACGLKHQVRSGGGTMRITETGLARSRARHGKLADMTLEWGQDALAAVGKCTWTDEVRTNPHQVTT